MTDDLILVSTPERALATVSATATPLITNTRQAFAWAFAASRELPANKLAHLNVDIKDAPILVRGALPKILPFRARLAALPEFELISLDTLGWHASATVHAQVLYMGACSGPAQVAALAKQARAWRLLLVQDATVLVTRGLLPAKKHAELKGQAGHKEFPYLLLALIELYRKGWTKLAPHSTMRMHELEEAESIAEQLAAAFATRADRTQAIDAANDQRRRNFTLLATTYDQVRRGLQYLRWHEDDLDAIAPSLYRGRGGSRRKMKVDPAAQLVGNEIRE